MNATLTFDNVLTSEQLHELMQTINRELDQGNLVRLINDWDVPNGATYVQRIIPASKATSKAASADSTSNAVQTIEQIAALPHVLLYPGYLHLCKPGTPARVIAIEDCGGFGARHLAQAHAYRLCMNNRYNKHDEDYDADSQTDTIGEDSYLDLSWEDHPSR